MKAIDFWMWKKNPAKYAEMDIDAMRREIMFIKYQPIDPALVNKYCKVELPTGDKTLRELRVWQIDTVHDNLWRIWNKTYDESVLPGILFMQKLPKLVEEINRYEKTGVISYQLERLLDSLKLHLNIFLKTYEDLHSVRSDDDLYNADIEDIDG